MTRAHTRSDIINLSQFTYLWICTFSNATRFFLLYSLCCSCSGWECEEKSDNLYSSLFCSLSMELKLKLRAANWTSLSISFLLDHGGPTTDLFIRFCIYISLSRDVIGLAVGNSVLSLVRISNLQLPLITWPTSFGLRFIWDRQ